MNNLHNLQILADVQEMHYLHLPLLQLVETRYTHTMFQQVASVTTVMLQDRLNGHGPLLREFVYTTATSDGMILPPVALVTMLQLAMPLLLTEYSLQEHTTGNYLTALEMD